MTRISVLAFGLAAALLASAPARADSCNQGTTTSVYGDGNYIVNNSTCTIVQQKQIAPYYDEDVDDDRPTVVYQRPYYGPVVRPYYMPMVRPVFVGGRRR
jgi:hypothetical protein